jgi:dihydrofolate reductase/thymidylate synthase
MKMKVSLIVALDSEYGISKNNKMPWHISEDLKFFSKTTEKSCVIMGRNTWESLPKKYKPLPNRCNIVISKTLDDRCIEHHFEASDVSINRPPGQVHFVKCISEAFKIYEKFGYNRKVFVIGGKSLYKQFLSDHHDMIDVIYLTKINHKYECDVYFPKDDLNLFLQNNKCFTEKINCNSILDDLNKIYVSYEIMKYSVIRMNLYEQYLDAVDDGKTIYEVGDLKVRNRNMDEIGYLDLLRKILEEDKEGRQTRNAKTFSVFGPQLEFDLSNDTLPLLTTRKMFVRGIFEELIFFIRGETNTKILEEKGVNIWKGNTSKEFLQSRNLNYPEGFMGPMYGFQWRHFGGEYGLDIESNSTNGYDQLYHLIQSLAHDPHSRRHLLTTYHPGVVDQSVLAPCHGIVVQFYVDNGNLDCKMYQRSCDTVLGEPFNITSYALMTHLIAWVCGLKARKLIMTLGDAHIYEQHLEGVREQLNREPFPFPKLKINKILEEDTVDKRIQFLEELKFEDIEVVGYQSHPAIKFKMVA